MFLSSLLSSYMEKVKDAEGETVGYVYEKLWTHYAQNALTQLFLWSAVVLLAVLLGVGLFVRFKKSEKLKQYLTVAITLFVGFCVTVIVAMTGLEFFDMHESGAVFDIVLYPAVTLAAATILGIAAVYIGSLYSKKTFKIVASVAVSVIGAALVAFLVCLIVYFTSGNAENNNGAEITQSENIALCLSLVGLVAVIALIAVFCGRGEKKEFDTKSISYAAVCVAMSFALSYIRLWKMPQGGSITFASLLPLMLYSYMFGVRKGVYAGLVYGVLQAVQDPWLIHPAQFLLDYPVAFAAIGVTGMFARTKKLEKLPQVQFALGAVVASVLRFASHVLSGVFAFSEYSTLDNVWIYSMGYNSFVFVDIAIVIVVGVIVFCSPSIVKQARKFHPVKKTAVEPTQTELPTPPQGSD